MRFYCLFLIAIILSSCATVVIERPEIRGAIYDVRDKKPVQGVSVYIEDESKTSDNNGKFVIDGITKKKIFNFEGGHDPKFYSFQLKHPQYDSLRIKKGTRGSFDQKIIVYDSIFLKPIN